MPLPPFSFPPRTQAMSLLHGNGLAIPLMYNQAAGVGQDLPGGMKAAGITGRQLIEWTGRGSASSNNG